MNRLSKEDFSLAMHKGLGRAYLHVHQYGDKGFEEIIENAILHNLVFDVQSEGSRADWLFSILKETKQLQCYEDFLLSNFDNIEEDWDYDQGFDLLYHLAKNGNQKAREKLYQEFDKQQFNESWIGGEQIIELDGIKGFLHVAEMIGKRLNEDSDYWEDDYLLNDVKERFGKDEVEKALKENRRVSKHLEYYLQNIKVRTKGTPETKEQRTERIRQQWPVEQIKDDVKKAKGEIPGRYTTFGKYASEEDIKDIFEQLQKEKRVPQIIRLLWIFRRRELPEINDNLISYTKNKDKDLASAAISALANSKDKRLNKLARDVMSTEDWNHAVYGIELLIKNYEKGDEKKIEKLLNSRPNSLGRDDIHNVVYDLVNLAEKNYCDNLRNILIWIYENSPCMNCRGRGVKLMVEHDSISEDMINECSFDGDKEIREMVKQKEPSNPSIA